MERKEILKQFKKDKDNLINILHALQNNNPENYVEILLIWRTHYLSTPNKYRPLT